jgi:Na+-translocating ferredoxin:NAD+ oxidoreductase RnfC subunit
MDCIGCSRCVRVCPEGLNPMELYRAASTNRRETARRLGMDHCIGCSACSYICPSRLELSNMIQSKKAKWKNAEESRKEATVHAE